MKIRYELGDAFGHPDCALVHGCNMQGIMGSGFAKAIREQHPGAYRAYRQAHETTGLHLGQVVWAQCRGRHIGNCITQEHYGRDPNVVYCDYDAIRTAMREVNRKAAECGWPTVAMPQIGAGLAHGDWATIAGIVEDEMRDAVPVVYILDRALHRAALEL